MAHEFDGKKYETASSHQKEWGAKLIAELALRGDERVLDLGCGDGALTAESDRASFSALVVRRMIEETKENDGRCFETFRRINVLATKKP